MYNFSNDEEVVIATICTITLRTKWYDLIYNGIVNYLIVKTDKIKKFKLRVVYKIIDYTNKTRHFYCRAVNIIEYENRHKLLLNKNLTETNYRLVNISSLDEVHTLLELRKILD